MSCSGDDGEKPGGSKRSTFVLVFLVPGIILVLDDKCVQKGKHTHAALRGCVSGGG